MKTLTMEIDEPLSKQESIVDFRGLKFLETIYSDRHTVNPKTYVTWEVPDRPDIAAPQAFFPLPHRNIHTLEDARQQIREFILYCMPPEGVRPDSEAPNDIQSGQTATGL